MFGGGGGMKLMLERVVSLRLGIAGPTKPGVVTVPFPLHIPFVFPRDVLAGEDIQTGK
jgi:hypothetical protein